MAPQRSRRSRSVRHLDSWRPGMDGGVALDNSHGSAQNDTYNENATDSHSQPSRFTPSTPQAMAFPWHPAPYPDFYNPPHAPVPPAPLPFPPLQSTPSSFTPINPRWPSSKTRAPRASQTRNYRTYTPRVTQPIAPNPTEEYLIQANGRPKSMPPGHSRPLLVVLDLNGTLIYRNKRKNPRHFVRRPGVEMFLDHIMAHHKVMIWSSSRPDTIHGILEKIPMNQEYVAVWSRDELGLTPEQYREKVQVYKNLDKIWADNVIQSHHLEYKQMKTKFRKNLTRSPIKRFNPDIDPKGKLFWDQTNTVLIDDSRLKAAAQPHNILEISEFTGGSDPDGSASMAIVLRQLDILSRQQDVSKQIREWNMKKPSTNSSTKLAQFWQRELKLPFYKGDTSALSPVENYVLWAHQETSARLQGAEFRVTEPLPGSPNVMVRLSDEDTERLAKNKEYRANKRKEDKRARRIAKLEQDDPGFDSGSSPIVTSDRDVSGHFDAALASLPPKPPLPDNGASDSDKSPGGVNLLPN